MTLNVAYVKMRAEGLCALPAVSEVGEQRAGWAELSQPLTPQICRKQFYCESQAPHRERGVIIFLLPLFTAVEGH